MAVPPETLKSGEYLPRSCRHLIECGVGSCRCVYGAALRIECADGLGVRGVIEGVCVPKALPIAPVRAAPALLIPVFSTLAVRPLGPTPIPRCVFPRRAACVAP